MNLEYGYHMDQARRMSITSDIGTCLLKMFDMYVVLKSIVSESDFVLALCTMKKQYITQFYAFRCCSTLWH